MARIDSFLKLVVEQGASDLHIGVGHQPYIRYNGDLIPIGFRPLSRYDGNRFIYEILDESQRRRFEEEWELDCSYEIPGLARFRVNIFMQRKGIGAAFRVIPADIQTIEMLGLPKVLHRFAEMERGLVLVTGPTGSGKSTTQAAIIDSINSKYCKHIITIEEPIEFVHQPKESIIFHREVKTHCKTFADALRSALRESPDVLLIGEMRDLETISLALTAAETGVLVFGTLHTNSAAETLSRIVDIFPEKEQEHIKTMLSVSLKGVIAQDLFKRADGKGRVAAFEILTSTYGLSNVIRDGKFFQIYTLIQTSDQLETGMQTMDQDLYRLVSQKLIKPQVAVRRAYDKKLFSAFLEEEEIIAAITRDYQ